MPLAEVGALATTLAKQRKQFKGMAHAIIAINRLGPSMSSRVCILSVYSFSLCCHECASSVTVDSDTIEPPLIPDGPYHTRMIGCRGTR